MTIQLPAQAKVLARPLCLAWHLMAPTSSSATTPRLQHLKQSLRNAVGVACDPSLFGTTIERLEGVHIVMANSGMAHLFIVTQQAHKHMRNDGLLILMSSVNAVWVCGTVPDFRVKACVVQTNEYSQSQWLPKTHVCHPGRRASFVALVTIVELLTDVSSHML